MLSRGGFEVAWLDAKGIRQRAVSVVEVRICTSRPGLCLRGSLLDAHYLERRGCSETCID